VTRIDPATRQVTKTIGISAPAIDLAVGAGAVWVATGGFGVIVQIDPDLGAATHTIELGAPGSPVVPAASAIAVTRDRVWVGALDGLVGIDPESGRQANRIDLGRAAALQIAAGYGSVWATTFANRAKRVEASSAQVTTEFYAGTFVFAIALDRSAVWVAAGGSGQLWELDPVTGASLGTARARYGRKRNCPRLPLRLGRVERQSHALSARFIDGKVMTAIPMGGTPEDVAVGGGLVWGRRRTGRRAGAGASPGTCSLPATIRAARRSRLGAQRAGTLG
jgi:hypothetical protein